MSYLIILWFTAFFWGFSLMNPRLSFHKRWPGLFMMAGFYLAIILLFISNALFHIPFFIGSKTVFLLGFILFLVKFPKIFKTTYLIKNLFTHPIFLYFSFFCLLLIFIGVPQYIPTEGDELSYWLFMPKKILYLNQIKDLSFPLQSYFHYTPGWPIILAYPLMLINAPFNPSAMPYAAWFSGFLLSALIFDLLINLGPKIKGISQKLIGWWGLLLILFLRAIGDVFPQNTLIETPLVHAMMGSLLVVYIMLNKGLDNKKGPLILGIFLSAGYLLKTPFNAILPSILIMLFLLANQFKTKLPLTHKLHFWLSLSFKAFLPLGLVMLVWKMYTSEVKIPKMQSFVLENSAYYQGIIKNFLTSLFTFFKKARFQMGLPGLILGLFYRRYRILSIGTWCFYLLYLLGLLGVYLFVFKGIEVSRLASFYRYHLLIVWVLSLIGMFITLDFIFRSQRLKKLCLEHKFVVSLKYLLLLSSLFLGYKLTLKARKHYENFDRLKPFAIIKESQLLKNQLVKKDESFFIPIPKIFLISQGESWGEVTDAWFESFDHEKIYYSVFSHHNWSNQLTESQVIERLGQADILWPTHTDDFMEAILTKLTQGHHCPKPFTQYFLWKEESQKDHVLNYSCTSKY